MGMIESIFDLFDRINLKLRKPAMNFLVRKGVPG